MTEGPTGARAAGIAKMEEVYGFSVDPDTIAGPYVDVTVDHLFGAIWTREALDTRDRRMLTIGVLAALGQANLLEIQFRSALERGGADRGAGPRDRPPPGPLHRLAPVDRGQRRRREDHRRTGQGGEVRRGRRGHRRAVRSPDMTAAPGTTPTTTFDFHDKVAIVTGSAGGIGQAYAEALAAAGASVVVADIDAAKAEAVAAGIRSSGGSALAVAVDVADPASAQAMAAGDRRRVRGHRLPGQQRRHLRRHEARPAADGRLGVPQPVPVGEHARRPQLRPGLLAGHEGPGRRGHRQPVVDGRLPVRRLLRAGQGRGQLDHPAAGPRAGSATTSGPTPSPPGPPTPRRRAPWCPTPS